MANFNKYIPLLTEFEGGYVDDPDDLGGATNMGITYRTFVDYLHKKGLSADKSKFKSMTIDLRNQIIKSEYWENYDAPKAGECSPDSLLFYVGSNL